MLLPANTLGSSRASSTVGGWSGQLGATALYPASSKNGTQWSQLLSSSHSPCTNTTGCFPEGVSPGDLLQVRGAGRIFVCHDASSSWDDAGTGPSQLVIPLRKMS